MPLGHLFRSRLRSDKNHGEIKMRISVIRITCNRLKYLFLGLLLPAFLARGDAEIIMGGGAVWIDLDRPAQLGQRVVESGLPIVNDSQGCVRKLVLGRNGQRLF